jgi:hypothetical protein
MNPQLLQHIRPQGSYLLRLLLFTAVLAAIIAPVVHGVLHWVFQDPYPNWPRLISSFVGVFLGTGGVSLLAQRRHVHTVLQSIQLPPNAVAPHTHYSLHLPKPLTEAQLQNLQQQHPKVRMLTRSGADGGAQLNLSPKRPLRLVDKAESLAAALAALQLLETNETAPS